MASSSADGENSAAQTIEEKTSPGVAFDIPVGNVNSIHQLPKRLQSYVRENKPILSAEELQHKQKMADERRKKKEEERLKRIHQRQEAARKLAHNVNILLQGRARAQGQGDRWSNEKLSYGQILAIAKEISKNFYQLEEQIIDDLKIEDGKSSAPYRVADHRKPVTDYNKNKQRNQGQHSKSEKSNTVKGGVSFVVALDDVTENKSNFPKCLSVSQSKPSKPRITQQDLEEKQRKAEHRRRRKQQERVRKTCEGREAVMKMAAKMERLFNHEAALCGYEGYGEDHKLAKEEAFKLAHEIADGFDIQKQRYKTDLIRAESFFVQQPHGLPKK